MTSVSSKQFVRREKKKRKLTALANIIQLNDQDRLSMAKEENQREMSDEPQSSMPQQSVDTNDDDDIGFETIYSGRSFKRGPPLSDDESCSSLYDVSRKRSRPEPEESNDEIEVAKRMPKDEYPDLRRKLRERKRQMNEVPHLQLRELGQRAMLDVATDDRTPIFLTDIQHLLMSALIGKNSPCTPDRWCLLQKSSNLSHSLVLVIEGMSLYHYLSNESNFRETNQVFKTRLEVVMPPYKDGKILTELAQIPLTNLQARELIEKYGSLETAVTMNKDPTLLVQSMFPMEKVPVQDKNKDTSKSTSETTSEGTSESDSNAEKKLPASDKFPRTKLLLSALQMVDEGYPMPLGGELRNRFKNYVFTKEKYEPVNDHSPMFGVDCEMCRTSANINELTRISIVNEKMETVYESLVRPDNKIVDYLTNYSGITPEILKSVTKNLKEVQAEIRALLPPDAILVGQSLQFDLHAMRMMHPYVIDTSVCFNLTGVRVKKSKLQQLAMIFLKVAIQEHVDGHDSVEDSAACLKLVQMKLANSYEFGDAILTEKRRLQEIIRTTGNGTIKNNLFAHVSKRDKRTAIITAGEFENSIKDVIAKADEVAGTYGDNLRSVNIHELESNKKAVKKAREIALEHALTITNIRIDEDGTCLNRIDETINKLDKWISKLWKSVAHNGLFLVLMTGSEDCPNGLATIAIKKNIPQVVAEVPLHV